MLSGGHCAARGRRAHVTDASGSGRSGAAPLTS